MSLKRRRLRVLPLLGPSALATLLSLALSGVSPAYADSKAKDPAQAADGKAHKLVSINAINLPRYSPPPAFREDLAITTGDGSFTMKRFVDHAAIRTEMEMKENKMVMIETGDAKGTVYTLMPEQKRAMKQTRQGMAEASAKAKAKMPEGKAGPDAKGTPPPDMQVEDLGEETLDGKPVKKLRMVAGGGDVLGWFDKGTGAPVRMESLVDGKKATLEWKNRKVEPQPAELFEVPKGYEVTDMDEMMAKMGSMGGMGGVGGMAKGMAGGMAQGMGSSLGGSIGSTLGGSLGGPLGAAAGQYLGGKIGGMLGKKAANAIN